MDIYSQLPQAKICASLGVPAPLPEVAGNLRYFDYHMEKS